MTPRQRLLVAQALRLLADAVVDELDVERVEPANDMDGKFDDEAQERERAREILKARGLL